MNPAVEAHAADPLAAWRIGSEPYYRAVGEEVRLFAAAHAQRMPLMLKGPTGCGKSRLVEFMAWRLGLPLVTVACNEDLGAADLVGRWLLDAQGTRWQDGPLALAARHGAICYLDEFIEARPDATVVIHPLADTRRVLPIERRNELLRAHPDFFLVASFNPLHPGAQQVLKMSTRQRFAAIEIGYPDPVDEAAIVAHEAATSDDIASRLVELGRRTRRLAGEGLEHGASTRMLIHAGALMAAGIAAADACEVAIVQSLSDDAELTDALGAAVRAVFP